MSNIHIEIENLFCLLLGKRYTRKQKNNFLKEIEREFNTKGIKTEVIKMKKAFNSFYHLIVGNIHKSKKLVVVYYDTPRYFHFSKHVYYPFNGKKNMRKNQREITFGIILSILFLAFIYLYISSFVKNIVIKIIVLIISVFIILMINNGSSNAYNYEQNTSSILFCIDNYEQIKKNDVSILFVDDCCNNYMGLSLLAREQPEVFKNKKIIILDCIGTGNDLRCYTSNNNQLFSKYKIECEKNNDYSYTPIVLFDDLTMISSGVMKNNDFVSYQYNTEINYERFEIIKNIINEI